MTEKEYRSELRKMPGSRQNDIIYAVNCKVPKKEADIKNETERMLYDELWAEATAHKKKYGDWPVFEMSEIETDDPRLDIYKDPPVRSHIDHIEGV